MGFARTVPYPGKTVSNGLPRRIASATMSIQPTTKMPPNSAWRLAVCLLLGASLWLLPHPDGLTAQAWHLLAVFIATIAGFILRPLPMAPLVLLGLLILSATKTLGESPKAALQIAFSGFGNTTVWLVVAAMLIAGAVIRTGLGRRIALLMVVAIGRTMLGLGYALCGTELILAPFIPSNTARGGGVMAPVVNSLARVLESRPEENPRHGGDFLVLCGAHANLITSAMFLTAMAANPLVAEAAAEIFGIEFGWIQWLKGSLLPGLVGLGLLPLLLLQIARPQRVDAQAARQSARDQLRHLGAWTKHEIILVAVFVLLLTLWSTKAAHELPTTWVALLGVVVLLLTGVEKWRDMAANQVAWDTLVWLGGLLTMAAALKEQGVIAWLAEFAQSQVQTPSAALAAIGLALIYFYSMYAFSMLTGHITAMVGAFFLLAAGAGTAPLLIVPLLAYFSSLCGCLTNYSTGPLIIYFGLGYVPSPRWFGIGWIVSLFHLAVWLGIGLPYWKWLGWW